ncbi:uncharacterized protein MKZ38_010304 [Zalerion maritima]|uniref:Replication factor C subunit 2 n=1 Tax=Zalerion maritima TaxID=339359 RepID=A0AAD5S0R7_9PEZI|nr:uncharacterized protein MKZ38_010304 [Zalerion maritima]
MAHNISALPQPDIIRLDSEQVISSPQALAKELVDNALDARATTIDVLISNDSVSKVEVRDNGTGIRFEDHDLVGRIGHTSKIQKIEDLTFFSGSSLGFRGQALSAAGHVATVAITTRTIDETIATELALSNNGDGPKSKKSVQGPVGTTVIAKDLFKSWPVRGKLFKKESAKSISKIKLHLIAVAMARPDVKLSFKVYNKPGTAWDYPANKTDAFKPTVLNLFGRELANECIEQAFTSCVAELPENELSPSSNSSNNDGRLCKFTFESFMAKPDADVSKISNKSAYISIDSRPQSLFKGTMKQLTKVYRNTLSKTLDTATKPPSEPFLRLNIKCPRGSYDPNVEPNKEEVLFFHETDVVRLFSEMCSRVYTKSVQDGSALAHDTAIDTEPKDIVLSEAGTANGAHGTGHDDGGAPSLEQSHGEIAILIRSGELFRKVDTSGGPGTATARPRARTPDSSSAPPHISIPLQTPPGHQASLSQSQLDEISPERRVPSGTVVGGTGWDPDITAKFQALQGDSTLKKLETRASVVSKSGEQTHGPRPIGPNQDLGARTRKSVGQQVQSGLDNVSRALVAPMDQEGMGRVLALRRSSPSAQSISQLHQNEVSNYATSSHVRMSPLPHPPNLSKHALQLQCQMSLTPERPRNDRAYIQSLRPGPTYVPGGQFRSPLGLAAPGIPGEQFRSPFNSPEVQCQPERRISLANTSLRTPPPSHQRQRAGVAPGRPFQSASELMQTQLSSPTIAPTRKRRREGSTSYLHAEDSPDGEYRPLEKRTEIEYRTWMNASGRGPSRQPGGSFVSDQGPPRPHNPLIPRFERPLPRRQWDRSPQQTRIGRGGQLERQEGLQRSPLSTQSNIPEGVPVTRSQIRQFNSPRKRSGVSSASLSTHSNLRHDTATNSIYSVSQQRLPASAASIVSEQAEAVLAPNDPRGYLIRRRRSIVRNPNKGHRRTKTSDLPLHNMLSGIKTLNLRGILATTLFGDRPGHREVCTEQVGTMFQQATQFDDYMTGLEKDEPGFELTRVECDELQGRFELLVARSGVEGMRGSHGLEIQAMTKTNGFISSCASEVNQWAAMSNFFDLKARKAAANGTPKTDDKTKEKQRTQPWVEKYRPKSLDDVTAQDHTVTVLQRTLQASNLPHMLFYGPPGTGKTSTILALAKQLYGPELIKSRVLELNASDERGISIVREKVKDFARMQLTNPVSTTTASYRGKYPCPPFKIIVLDEADSMTQDAQSALRRTMETYSRITRFCLICNYVTRIIDPLASRCSKFRFKSLDDANAKTRLEEIAKTEGVGLAEGATAALIRCSEGDLRKAITFLQSAARLVGAGDEAGEKDGDGDAMDVDGEAHGEGAKSKPVTVKIVEDIAGVIPGGTIDSLLGAIKSGSYDRVSKVVESMVADGWSAGQVVSQLYGDVVRDELIADKHKNKIVAVFSEIDKRLVDGADEHLSILDLAWDGVLEPMPEERHMCLRRDETQRREDEDEDEDGQIREAYPTEL